MIRFLLGVAVGAIATASYLQRRGSYEPGAPSGGEWMSSQPRATIWSSMPKSTLATARRVVKGSISSCLTALTALVTFVNSRRAVAYSIATCRQVNTGQ